MPPTTVTAPPAVATGRLGQLHTRAVVDDAIGAILGAVERIDVATPALALALALQTALSTELDHWTAQIDHVNVFQYDTVRTADAGARAGAVELLATRAVAKHLYGVVREFGRLHASVARHFMKAVVGGLGELHRHGIFCGGLSLSNLFLCEGRVQLGAWFPPVNVLQRLQETHPSIFTDNPYTQSVLRRHGSATPDELRQRDIRSLAFLIIEMVTGLRVELGQLSGDHDEDELIRPLPPHSMERAFVLELLQPSTSAKSLQTHPYLIDDRVPHHSATLAGGSGASQRELIAHLVNKEYVKCREMQRADAQQVRLWFAQFEKKFHRKPQNDERPASIQRLQRRCRALHERIHELERRAKVLDHAAQSAGQLVLPSGAAAEIASNASSQHGAFLASFASALDIDTTTNYDRAEDLVDQRRRSPAQNAFLRNLSSSAVAEVSPKGAVDAPPQKDVLFARDRGHELLHQRKEVMGVILGLEKQ